MGHLRRTEPAGRSGCDTDPHSAEQLTLHLVNETITPSTRAVEVATPSDFQVTDSLEGEDMIGVDAYLASRNYAATSLKQRRVILRQFVAAVGDSATCDAETVLNWWAGLADLAPASRRAHQK